MARDNLERRGRQWYLRLSVPRSLRHRFCSPQGNPRAHIVESLGDSYEIAKVRAAQRTAVFTAIFGRLKAGEPMTDEQIAAEVRGDAFAEDPPAIFSGQERDDLVRQFRERMRAAAFEIHGDLFGTHRIPGYIEPAGSGQSMDQPATGETISQAAEAWIKEITRDKATAPRPLTIDGHRKRVKKFIDQHGDLPLTEISKGMASDFLRGLNLASSTRNAYSTTLGSVFEDARKRDRFTGDNPFDGMKAKKGGNSYVPFTIDELRILFAKLPREIVPAKHTPDTALPWVAAIALYTGARLEEIAQLTVADIRECPANGGTVWCIDIHNGGSNRLKNETSARLVPVHSELARAGFLEYVKALKAGPLFPGLKRRESKGGKLSGRLGELFRKTLVRLGIKREGLCFHSFRHTVAGRLDAAEVRQSDAARVLGHAVEGMSFGTYSQEGPGLKQVAATVEKITYEGLRL
jgi:integrase